MDKSMPSLFISYSNRDKEIVMLLVERLRGQDIDVWFDSNLLQGGDNWREVLDNALEKADGVLFLMTENSMRSEYVMAELGAAKAYARDKNRSKLILPVVYKLEEIPKLVMDLNVITWREDNLDEVIQRIVKASYDFMHNSGGQVSNEPISENISNQARQSSRGSESSSAGRSYSETETIPSSEVSNASRRREQNPETKKTKRKPTEKMLPADPKPEDEPANETEYLLLKMNPLTWEKEYQKNGDTFYFMAPSVEQHSIEFLLLKQNRKAKKVLCYDFNTRSLRWEMEIQKSQDPYSEKYESPRLKLIRELVPPVTIEHLKKIIPDHAKNFEDVEDNLKLFFEIPKEIYEALLSPEAPPKVFENIFEPFYLTEGDHKKTTDQLDFQNDIDSFASVIALKKVNPPLAIGLFGNWGSGKSFFMEKLIEAIQAKADGKDEDYIKQVVQVKFNSWHYSDSNLWASLITEIFDSLSRYLTNSKEEVELKKISETLQITSMQKEVMEEKRRDLESEISKLEEEKRMKRKRLEDLSGIKLVKLILTNDKIKKDLNELNNDNVEQITADANKLDKYQKEISNLGNSLKYYFRFLGDLKGWRWPLVIIIMILVFAASYFIMPYFFSEWWERTTLKVSGIISVAVALIGNALALIRPVKRDLDLAFQRLESMKQTLVNRPDKVDPELEDRKANLEALKDSLTAINVKIESARKEISDIVTGKKLLDFIETRTRDENYAKQLGLISWIRKDFDKLDELLRKQHEVDEETKKTIINPQDVQLKIDRIVLYIDDLDRCNEDIVVKVLEAIHLLLAFPLFVVVVGVDPRWLNNALSEKYKLLFGNRKNKQGSNGTAENLLTKQEESDLFMAGVATSYDYLEKIFQIPFTLKPINKTGREKLIGYLIKDEMMTEGKNRPDPHTTGSDTDSAKNINNDHPVADKQNNLVSEHEKKLTDDKKKQEDLLKLEKEKQDEASKKAKEKIVKQRMVFSTDELQYMQKLSGLYGNSPRAINRYVNIYRIIKAHKSMKVIGDFSRDEYIPIMFTLGIVIGFSAFAQEFIDKMSGTADKKTLKGFIKDSDLNTNLIRAINKYSDEGINGMPMENFKRNLELISRFSFRTVLKQADS